MGQLRTQAVSLFNQSFEEYYQFSPAGRLKVMMPQFRLYLWQPVANEKQTRLKALRNLHAKPYYIYFIGGVFVSVTNRLKNNVIY